MPCTGHVKYRIVQNVSACNILTWNPSVHLWPVLLPTEPAGDTALGLAGLLLDLLVELVDLLDGGTLGVLCVGRCLVLAFLELGLGLGELWEVTMSIWGSPGTNRGYRAWGEEHTASSNLAPAWRPVASASFSYSLPLPGSSPLTFAEALWTSAVVRARWFSQS